MRLENKQEVTFTAAGESKDRKPLFQPHQAFQIPAEREPKKNSGSHGELLTRFDEFHIPRDSGQPPVTYRFRQRNQ